MPRLVKIKNTYVEAGKTGLPLPSQLNASFLGTRLKDKEGNVRVLRRNAVGNLYWASPSSPTRKSPRRRSPKKKKSPRRLRLTKTRKMYYRREIERNLDDEDEIRDIFLDVIEELN